ncbi:hypothetical protein [Chryseobacterium sp. G0201]|uniref:hypothetical protein n=1 Tax=Chryseobacterium sp. G0201 TaxID=2487065 RepID=UPI000F4F9F16|nr:hypothetical protein [Chryseobacterium sp. G0201]AZA51538.1 hypothetical protein EG348_00230 [Chryseobacterium sp. G0201]
MAKLESIYKTISHLNDFPEHWKVLRIKNVFVEIDERSEYGTEELLSVSHYTGVEIQGLFHNRNTGALNGHQHNRPIL